MSAEYNKTIWQNGDVISVEKLNKIENGIAAMSNTVNSPAIYDTATGSIASFSDGADDLPMKNAVINIEPIQDLHGYDYPWPAGGSVNKCAPRTTETATNYGVTISATDGIYTLSGTSTGTWVFDHEIDLPAGEYAYAFFNGEVPGGSIYILDASNNVLQNISISSANRASVFSLTTDAVTMRIRGTKGNTYNNVKLSPMIVGGSTVPAAYQPYSNICPIRGRTGLSVVRSGKNLIYTSPTLFQKDGLTLSQKSDGGIMISGTYTRNANIASSLFENLSLPNGDYKLSGMTAAISSLGYRIQIYDLTNDRTKGSDVGEGLSFSITDSEKIIVRLYVTSSAYNVPVDFTIYPMITKSEERDQSFEPYKGSSYSVNWETEAGTVYGGYVDAVSGKLVVDRVMYNLNTSAMNNSENYPGWKNTGIADIIGTGIQTANYPAILNIGESVAVNTTGSGTGVFYLPTQTYIKTQSEWIAEALDVQILFDTVNPVEYQLSESEVRTLLGVNNVWSDAGDIAVEYPADTKLYIDRKIAEALS